MDKAKKIIKIVAIIIAVAAAVVGIAFANTGCGIAECCLVKLYAYHCVSAVQRTINNLFAIG